LKADPEERAKEWSQWAHKELPNLSPHRFSFLDFFSSFVYLFLSSIVAQTGET
jgi:hypothetical protein